MPILIVASSEPRVGRSLIAAAVAYRLGRAGMPVTLARLAGDEAAVGDAATFASLDGVLAPAAPITPEAAASLATNVILEAPAGSVAALASSLSAKVLHVQLAGSPDSDVPAGALAGRIVVRARAADVAALQQRAGVLAVLAEDRLLAAPSVRDIAAALHAKWLADVGEVKAIGRVMIGTVASDAAGPYFGARERKCVITRYDKTDIQLAALGTDMELLVLTGGGQPSPYLLDRILGTRDDISVLLADDDTVGVMRTIEGLYETSRFEGQGKLERAVELLDLAGVEIAL